MNPPFQTLAAQASLRHGVFTFDDAVRHEVSPHQLRSLVRSGWCERAHEGVYRVRAAPRTAHQRILIAVLGVGEDAVASHRSAAHLWGIVGYSGATAEVTRPHGRSQRSDLGVVHGSLWLPPRHLTTRHGIAVTTPARTAFDLAGIVAPKRLERDVDDLIARRVCTPKQIEGAFFAMARRGRRGTVAMRDRLEAMGSGYLAPASELERRGRALVAEAGLPMPRFEVHLGDEEWIGRVDLLWDAQLVVVELDGERFHGSPMRREADRRRDNRLMAAGWRVLRVTWDDLRDRPQEVIAWIRAALRSVPGSRM